MTDLLNNPYLAGAALGALVGIMLICLFFSDVWDDDDYGD